MTKLTTRNTGLATLAESEQCLDQIAELTVKRDKAKARLAKAILSAREEHGGVAVSYTHLDVYKRQS